jgi:alkylation response protein AidB-like acyl-CoA dehydrogenase
VNTPSTLPSDEERKMLYGAVSGFLKSQWPVEKAVEQATRAEAVKAIWRSICQQGLATLGTDPSEGGLREILMVLEALGRASCPAPMLEAAIANLVLWPKRNDSADLEALMTSLHQGDAALSIAFGAFDHDAGAGSIHLENNTVTGEVNFVEGLSTATHFMLFTQQGPAVAIVDAGAPGIEIAATPGLAVPPLSRVTFTGSPAMVVELSAGRIQDLNLIYRLGLAARAHGAAGQSFELLVDYVKDRKQFGRRIGSFQAIQHKMANCLISLDGVRLTIDQAAGAYDSGSDDWSVFASAAYAFASPAIRQVSLETHHAFGAIGYSEEHEAPRHFRRVHADLVRCGGVLQAREELAEYLLGPAH